MSVRLAIAGVSGRMGRVLVRVISQTAGCQLVGGLEAPSSPSLGCDLGELAGLGQLGVQASDDPETVIKSCDAVIDFTTPQATLALLEITAKWAVVHVIGTTGIDVMGDEKIRQAATSSCIIKSGNMSLGVNILASLVKKVAQSLGDDFDIEVLEMHHRNKIDAPSGTALLLAQAAADGRDINLSHHAIRSRDGITGVRPSGDIGFANLRGGSVVGDHTVIFAGSGERLELSHKAENRDLFAQGAIRAAQWGQGKKPGLYSMFDVLGLE